MEENKEICINENAAEKPAEKSPEEIISEYERDLGELRNRLSELKKERVIEVSLMKNGARNLTAAKALIDKNKLTFDEKGEVFGLDEQIERLKNSENSSFLFQNPRNIEIVGAEITENLCGNEFYSDDVSEINLTKQGSLYKNNPSLAQKITKTLFGK